MFFSSNLPRWQKYDSFPRRLRCASPRAACKWCTEPRCAPRGPAGPGNQKPCRYLPHTHLTKHSERHVVHVPHQSVPLPPRHPTNLPRLSELETWTEDGIQCSQGELTRNVKKRHAPSKARPQAKGLWEGFYTAVAALCQGLLSPPVPPIPKHPKKKIRSFRQSRGWHHRRRRRRPASSPLLCCGASYK